ncbi:hypothetical protein SAMN02745912_02391 [Paramaledivibacter caminithermalis DSM 15212]|jgi:hypothetical protein|uniref:Uncharacterized protein n=1 Tax=Paramaledivibacter caminithermalis (strain DSM 15212 / CIP 107654 / DViRD3) TaxID=1121301 RepID=A0A1M6Q269_PARC5|nr:hypothetical protein SAMN02745912_02391 [Paramaledivibacter caminithermalis DSM 15212]
MKVYINKKIIVIIFLIMISLASFYHVSKKTKINRPMSAKLVFNTEYYFISDHL